MKKIVHKKCPLCGSTQIKPMLTCTDFYASGEAFMIYSCRKCGFAFTQEAPAGDDMDAYYASGNYISHSDTKQGVVNRMYHIVRSYMLGKKARLVSREAHRRCGRLLDIGTGTGYFPATMQSKGWQVVAIEKNEEAQKYAKRKFGLDVRPTKALYEPGLGEYDVISLWHVMEHMEEMDAVWKRVYKLLAAQGILVVATPNAASFDAEQLGPYWAAYDVPRHLWHFTPSTMQQMASKHGFILAAHYPMHFDAFYIAILSERNKNTRFGLLKGISIGIVALMRSLVKKEKSSSMIYIFRKKVK